MRQGRWARCESIRSSEGSLERKRQKPHAQNRRMGHPLFLAYACEPRGSSIPPAILAAKNNHENEVEEIEMGPTLVE
jgi:hypothetical protein